MAKVVSILSAGHSGSTLLDMVCGSISSVFSLGEVTYLPWQIYRTRHEIANVENQNICTCRNDFRHCPVWSEVIRRISMQTGVEILKSPFAFRIALLQSQRYKKSHRFSLERAKRGLLLALIKHDFARPTAGIFYAMNREVVINNWRMFDEVGNLQNTQYVVDSTKSPERLWLLYQHRPKDTKAIILFRDVRAVAYSAVRRYNADPLIRAKGWVRIYNRIFNVLQAMPDLPVKIVHYEDLCSEPVKTRAGIANFLGLPDVSTMFPLDSTKYHLVAGNPMRYQESINLRYDDAWLTKLEGGIVNQIEPIIRGFQPAWKDLGYTGYPFT